MSQGDRRRRAAAAQIEILRRERDHEAAARMAAEADVLRLQEQVVRLQARVVELEIAEHAQGYAAPAVMRGLASLITPGAGADKTA